MNADLSQILAVGSGVVILAVAALALLVRHDLAPAGAWAGALDGGGRWFLGAALGIGVIAFTIKLAIISTLASFPDWTIDPLLPDPASAAERRPAAEMPDGSGTRRDIWRPLPAAVPAPPGNPTNPAKVALGERLFHDARLSATGTVACASCHDVRSGAGDDRRPTAIGVTATPGRRNSPTVFNAAFQARLFWDGRAASLEEQAQGPLVNPDEMGMPSLAAVEERVAAEPTYRAAFAAAFGGDAAITIDRIAQAIAAYERTLVTADSPYDRFVQGDESALTAAQRRGMALFEATGCTACHSGPNFSGASLVGPRSPYAVLLAGARAVDRRYRLGEDKGRAGADAPNGIWRIPSLRNVALTAPYFHNGAVADLSEAVRLMAELQLGVTVGPTGSTRQWSWSSDSRTFSRVERPSLSEADIADIVAFLRALTSDRLANRKAVAG